LVRTKSLTVYPISYDRTVLHPCPCNTIDGAISNIRASGIYTTRYNAAPTQLLPVITHESPEGFSFFYWGSAPQWAKNKTLAERIINTRAELIQDKPVFKKSLMRSRCIIPADGFYAWKKVGKKTSIPWRFVLKSKKIASFAGIWEEYDDSEGQAYHTFTLITVGSQ
jgi:putative SOS response-associated peptidase YedK